MGLVCETKTVQAVSKAIPPGKMNLNIPFPDFASVSIGSTTSGSVVPGVGVALLYSDNHASADWFLFALMRTEVTIQAVARTVCSVVSTKEVKRATAIARLLSRFQRELLKTYYIATVGADKVSPHVNIRVP